MSVYWWNNNTETPNMKWVYKGMITAKQLLSLILRWISRVARCLFWVCFHLVWRAYLELCYSNLFMFKCHLSGLAKEALVVGVHIGWKLRIPQLGGGGFSLCLQRRAHFRNNHVCTWWSLMKFSYGWFEERSPAAAEICKPCQQVSDVEPYDVCAGFACNMHWEECCASSEMEKGSNSCTTVVYAGPITLSVCNPVVIHIMSGWRMPHQTGLSSHRSLWSWEKTTLNRLQHHVFMSAVGLVVEYFRDTYMH